MKNKPVTAIAILLALSLSFQSKSQSTFSSVSQVIQANCTSSGCHNTADAAAGLDFSASLSDVYSALVNTAPQNQAAAAKGNKLVAPGYVIKSFLFRKIATGFDPMVLLDSTENTLPFEHQQLGDSELELIRQWIQYGASQTDTVIDVQAISDFYSGSGLPLIDAPPSPAEQGLEGMQLRIGPIMLMPEQEEEFFHKFKTELPAEKEVYRMEAVFDHQSHHFVIYNFDTAAAATYPEGPQNAGSYAAQIPIHFGANELDAWNVSRDDVLPPGTAYFWDPTTQVVLDFHVRNYSDSMILGATSYINIYTRDKQPGTREMKMEFPVFGGLNPFLLKIPPTGQPFKQEFTFTTPGEVWDIWKTQGHTHLLGTDFDVFVRNPDGTRGQQIYEGYYNADYSYNQGYFDNQHAPVRTTENPFVTVDMNDGVILEATWVNNGPDTVGFGLTTKDEMFAAYLTYTLAEKATSVSNAASPGADNISIYPNPSNGEVKIVLHDSGNELKTIRIFSVSGMLMYENPKCSGNEFNLPEGTLQAGLYLLEVNGNDSQMAKVVIY